jgi:glycerol dehydrogenase
VCNRYEFIIHTGTCNEERAKELADLCRGKGYDVIVGVGGGVIMDFAKLCGHFAALPVINVPTSSATCACYTPLSVRYTPEGKTVGSLHYEHEVDCVIADTAVIATQPVRLLLAGVFDALAKFVEIRQRYRGDTADVPLGLDYAYAMAEHSYRVLTERTDAAIDAMQTGQITVDFEQLVFTTLAATGVISGIARGSNQCALAHKFYEITRVLFHESARPYLHGEIVGVGLLLQNHFNGEEERNAELLTMMRKYGMPASVKDIGVQRTEETMEEYVRRLCASSAIDEADPAQCRRLRRSLEYFMKL